MGEGSYLVLPVLGPSSTRDWTRYPAGWATSPTTWALWDENWYWSAGLWVVDGLDTRARLLELEKFRESTVDEYAAVRDAYLAARRRAVADGEAMDAEEELETLTPLDFSDEE